MVILFSLISLWFSYPQEYQYIIEFSKIDNRAQVWIGDEEVFDSDFVDKNPEMKLKFDLTPHLKKGNNTIKITLYNGSRLSEFMDDKNWVIRYEIFENGDSYDYIYETSKDGPSNQIVFEQEHDIYVE